MRRNFSPSLGARILSFKAHHRYTNGHMPRRLCHFGNGMVWLRPCRDSAPSAFPQIAALRGTYTLLCDNPSARCVVEEPKCIGQQVRGSTLAAFVAFVLRFPSTVHRSLFQHRMTFQHFRRFNATVRPDDDSYDYVSGNTRLPSQWRVDGRRELRQHNSPALRLCRCRGPSGSIRLCPARSSKNQEQD